jgi:Nucleotidyl transferase AbiEii toxin, Type IV TA system
MLTATEFSMHEPVPIHRVQEAIFEFCRGHADAVVFGAQAVNVYAPVPRMTQDVDLLSSHPREVAEELARLLGDRLHIAVRVREVSAGRGFRVYQVRREGNRHLADVRLAEFSLDDSLERDGIRYVSLPTVVALKLRALAQRRLAPKGATDLADLRRLLIAHPELRTKSGTVADAIERTGGGDGASQAWHELLEAPLITDEDVDEGY